MMFITHQALTVPEVTHFSDRNLAVFFFGAIVLVKRVCYSPSVFLAQTRNLFHR